MRGGIPERVNPCPCRPSDSHSSRWEKSSRSSSTTAVIVPSPGERTKRNERTLAAVIAVANPSTLRKSALNREARGSDRTCDVDATRWLQSAHERPELEVAQREKSPAISRLERRYSIDQGASLVLMRRLCCSAAFTHE